MKKILIFIILINLFLPHTSFADKAFDMEEYGSVEELAAVVEKRVFALLGRSDTAKGKVRLAVVQAGTGRTDVTSSFIKKLGENDAVFVLDSASAMSFVKQKRQAGRLLVPEMLQTFGLDAVISVRVYPSDGGQLVLLRIFSGGQGMKQDTFAAIVAVQGSKSSAIGADGRWTAYPDLPIAARYFDVADIDGDGSSEYIFSDEEGLFVYKIESSAWREVWSSQQKGMKSKGRTIYLAAADINGNSRPEIFVTYMEGGRIMSRVFESKGEEFVRIAEIPVFLRVLLVPGRGPVLLGQGFSENRFFDGVPREYRWTGKDYSAGPEFNLPKGVALYGFSAVDFGEQSVLIVSQNDKNRLQVYSQDTLVWEGQEKYGAMDTVVVESTGDIYNVSRKVAIRGRVEAFDIDNNGIDDIIIPRNTGATVFKSATGAEMYVLSWTGARLERVGIIKDLPGPVMDYKLMNFGADRVKIVALVEVEGGAFSGPLSRLVAFTIK